MQYLNLFSFEFIISDKLKNEDMRADISQISGLFGKCDYINCDIAKKRGEEKIQISKKLSASISSLWEAIW